MADTYTLYSKNRYICVLHFACVTMLPFTNIKIFGLYQQHLIAIKLRGAIVPQLFLVLAAALSR